jgi:hypothetical protein
MFKHTFVLSCTLFLAFSGCTKESIGIDDSLSPNDGASLSYQEVSSFMFDKIEATQKTFDWADAPDEIIWGALENGEYVAGLGYKPVGFDLDENILNLEISQPAWRSIRDELVELIVSETNRLSPGSNFTIADLILGGLEDDAYFPDLDAYVMHPEIMEALQNHPAVYYFEPLEFDPQQISLRSEEGCDGATPEVALNAAAPGNGWALNPGSLGVRDPWPFLHSRTQIKQVWPGYGSGGLGINGCGIGIAVIDTGVSPDQTVFGGAWKHVSYSGPDRLPLQVILTRGGGSQTGYSDCGHGTQMVSLVGAPRRAGGICGVANGANVYSYRASNSVLINGRIAKNGVRDAYRDAADIDEIKVITMSMGRAASVLRITNAIKYADEQGKLIFGAAGTGLQSIGAVVFPADDRRVQAVTGVEDNNTSQKCANCHDGAGMMFTVPVGKENGQETPTLAMSGLIPAQTLGSSPATAITAGVAALVWSRYPSEDKDEILTRLINASERPNNPSDQLGHGVINALTAVGGEAAINKEPCNY